VFRCYRDGAGNTIEENWGCWLTQVVLYNSCKMLVAIVVVVAAAVVVMAIQTHIYVCSHKAYVDAMLLYRPRLVTDVVVCE